MYLQNIKKTTLSLFGDKRCGINETDSKSWKYSYLLAYKSL